MWCNTQPCLESPAAFCELSRGFASRHNYWAELDTLDGDVF